MLSFSWFSPGLGLRQNAERVYQPNNRFPSLPKCQNLQVDGGIAFFPFESRLCATQRRSLQQNAGSTESIWFRRAFFICFKSSALFVSTPRFCFFRNLAAVPKSEQTISLTTSAHGSMSTRGKVP